MKKTEELDYVEQILAEARELHLEAEVVTTALNSMKENPRMSVEDAITIGYHDWIT